MRFEPRCSCALDVGAGESLREAADFIGAPLEPDRGGVGVVDELSVGLLLASYGVQNGVCDGRGRVGEHGGMTALCLHHAHPPHHCHRLYLLRADPPRHCHPGLRVPAPAPTLVPRRLARPTVPSRAPP